MDMFFFNIIGRTVEKDEIGTEFPSIHHAKQEGIRFIGSLLANDITTRQGERLALEIENEKGCIMFRLDIMTYEDANALAV